LGSKPAVEVDLFEGEIASGDTLLLCSDGLTGRVADQEVADIVRASPPSEAARRLVALANERGGNDNITVLIIYAEEAMPTIKAPVPPAKPQPARRSRTLPILAVLGGLLLLGAVALGLLAVSGILPLSFLQESTTTPAPTTTPGPPTATVETGQPVTPTGAPPATATLSPTGTAGVVLTPTVTAEPGPAASPGPSLGAVTLLSPTNGISLTGVVTFTWSLDPGPLAEDYAFWLFIGQGDPPDLRDRNLNRASPHRELQQRVDLDASLTEIGEYYWTVVIVGKEDDDRPLTEPTYRSFTYLGPATPTAGG
jgi:hypothetical protein